MNTLHPSLNDYGRGKFPCLIVILVLGVSEFWSYEQRERPPSERAIWHAKLTDLLTQIQTESNGAYGLERVHAELSLGRGVEVGVSRSAY